jgi:WD40 repeat protein
VHGFSWSHDRELLAGIRGSYRLARIERPIALWDVQSGREITPDWLERHTHAVFAPSSAELLTLDEKGRVVVWPIAEVANPKQPAPTVPPFGEGYWTAVMSPDAEWIAAVATNDIALWKRSSLASGPRMLTGHTGSIRSMQFSADSQRLVSAGEDRTARVWEVSTDAPPVALTGGHSAALSWATFNPAGTLIATASADGSIRVWDAATLRTLAVLRWHGDAVNQVQFSPDGQWLLSASDDGTVRLGQCEPCGLTQDELRASVHELARMPHEQMQDVQREIAQATATFRLLTLFTRR